MEEISSAKKRAEEKSQLLGEEPAKKQKKKQGKIVVRYVEDNVWEQEVWRNYYVFDYNSNFVQQFQFLNTFMGIFDKIAKNKASSYTHHTRDRTCRTRTTYSITMQRSAEVDEDALKMEFCRRTYYKDSKCYSFDCGTELPHYREVQEFCKKNDIHSIASMKQKLPKLMIDEHSNVIRFFYKSFGDYKQQYGDKKLMFKQEDDGARRRWRVIKQRVLFD
jgi:hypothetical protein